VAQAAGQAAAAPAALDRRFLDLLGAVGAALGGHRFLRNGRVFTYLVLRATPGPGSRSAAGAPRRRARDAPPHRLDHQRGGRLGREARGVDDDVVEGGIVALDAEALAEEGP